MLPDPLEGVQSAGHLLRHVPGARSQVVPPQPRQQGRIPSTQILRKTCFLSPQQPNVYELILLYFSFNFCEGLGRGLLRSEFMKAKINAQEE